MRAPARVLIVNTRHHRGGGDSAYAFALADLLRAHGHDVSFFAMADPRNVEDPNADLFVTHVDYAAINRNRTLRGALRVAARSVYSVEARRKFRAMVARVRPDIVHCHAVHAHLTPSVVLEASASNLPVVWTLHDYKLVCPNTHLFDDRAGTICEACLSGRFHRAIRARCKKGSLLASAMAAVEAYTHRALRVARHVDAFVAPSEFLRGTLVASGLPPTRVHHVPLFVPRLAAPRRPPADPSLFVYSGRILAIKGIPRLVEACAMEKRVRLVLAGRAGDEAGEKCLAALPANAEYAGVLREAELRALVGRATAVVVPSLWYENQPFSVLEAFAEGTPVIASAQGGMRELVGNNERGWLVPADDAPALAGAMGWAAGHPGVARQLGENAWRYVRAHHGADLHYQRIVRVYESVGRA